MQDSLATIPGVEEELRVVKESMDCTERFYPDLVEECNREVAAKRTEAERADAAAARVESEKKEDSKEGNGGCGEVRRKRPQPQATVDVEKSMPQPQATADVEKSMPIVTSQNAPTSTSQKQQVGVKSALIPSATVTSPGMTSSKVDYSMLDSGRRDTEDVTRSPSTYNREAPSPWAGPSASTKSVASGPWGAATAKSNDIDTRERAASGTVNYGALSGRPSPVPTPASSANDLPYQTGSAGLTPQHSSSGAAHHSSSKGPVDYGSFSQSASPVPSPSLSHAQPQQVPIDHVNVIDELF